MSDRGSVRTLPIGKLPAELLARLLATTDRHDDALRLGPSIGEDACAVDVPAGVLVAAADPITLTSAEVGRMAVLVNANDVAVCGARPRWFLAAVLLPPGTSEALVEDVFSSIGEALAEIGASLAGGHTEVTPAVNQPVVVGQMLGMAEHGRFVATSGATVGDIVVQVGEAPIEGAAVLASEAAHRLDALPPEVVAEAAAGLHDPGISVVEPALAAAALGATAMHDPTEGGLAAALHELATAAGVGIELDATAVRWFRPGVEVCRAVGADPWATLASGTLLATFPATAVAGAMAELEGHGWPVAAIGTVVDGSGVSNGAGAALPWPDRDELARVLADD